MRLVAAIMVLLLLSACIQQPAEQPSGEPSGEEGELGNESESGLEELPEASGEGEESLVEPMDLGSII